MGKDLDPKRRKKQWYLEVPQTNTTTPYPLNPVLSGYASKQEAENAQSSYARFNKPCIWRGYWDGEKFTNHG